MQLGHVLWDGTGPEGLTSKSECEEKEGRVWFPARQWHKGAWDTAAKCDAEACSSDPSDSALAGATLDL
eukprot:748290-Rhodomonas_salina.9